MCPQGTACFVFDVELFRDSLRTTSAYEMGEVNDQPRS